MKKVVLIGLGALLVFVLRAAGDPPASMTTDHTTTAMNGRRTHSHNEHSGPARASETKNQPDSKKLTNGAATGTKAVSTDTSATATDSAGQTESASASDGSTASGNHTGTNTTGASGDKASTPTSATGTTGTDTTGNNQPPQQSRINWMLVAVLILVALTLAAVTTSSIGIWGRLADLESRLRKLDSSIESSLGSLTRDLSPLVGTPSRVIKIHELAEGISRDVTVLRSDVAEIKKRPKGNEGGGEREKTSSRPQQTIASYEPEPPVERDDESIHDLLRQVASDCVQSPITQSQVRARVGRGWDISSFGTGELPDGFIVDTGRGDAWFVPNTRRWSALRGEGLFDVAGPDLPTARIIRIDSLPRVRRGGGAIQLTSGKRGRLEISIA